MLSSLNLTAAESFAYRDKNSVISGSKVEGWLFKKTRNWKKRWFVLGEHELSYYEGPPKPGSKSGMKGSIPLKDTLLYDMREDSIESKVHRYCLRLKPVKFKEYIVGCDNKNDKEEWFAILKDAISHANECDGVVPESKGDDGDDDAVDDREDNENKDDDDHDHDLPLTPGDCDASAYATANTQDTQQEGWLMKKTKNWKKRYFVLKPTRYLSCDDVIMCSLQYYEEPPNSGGQLKGLVNLKGCEFTESGGEKGKPFSFKLLPALGMCLIERVACREKCHFLGKEYVLSADSQEEKDVWTSKIVARIAASNSDQKLVLSSQPVVPGNASAAPAPNSIAGLEDTSNVAIPRPTVGSGAGRQLGREKTILLDSREARLASVRARAMFGNMDLNLMAEQMTLVDSRIFKEIMVCALVISNF